MPTIVLTGVAAIAAFVFFILWAVFGTIKASEPYKYALRRASEDERVQSALGIPVDDKLLITGSISTSGSSGSARLDIPIYGPKNTATLHVEAIKSAGVWTYKVIDVVIPGQPAAINLAP